MTKVKKDEKLTVPSAREPGKISTRSQDGINLQDSYFQRQDFELDVLDQDFSAFKHYFLSLARENNCAKVKNAVEKLIEYIKVNPITNEKTKEVKSVSDSLKQMLDKEIEEDGFTMIYAATKHKSLDVLKLLLEYGADVNTNEMLNFSPLHIAAWGRKMATKKIKKENETLITDTTTALSKTERLEELKTEGVVDFLISHKADPNTLYPLNNFTPLHGASLRGNISAIRALLRCKEVVIDVIHLHTTKQKVVETYSSLNFKIIPFFKPNNDEHLM